MSVSQAFANQNSSSDIQSLRKKETLPNASSSRYKKSKPHRATDSNPGLQALLYVVNPGVYSERFEDQEQKLRRPENYAFGARYKKLSGYLESSQFEEVTGQGNYSVERKRKSFLLWGNYDIAEVSEIIYFPLGIGAGVYNETSITKIPGLEERFNGEYQWNFGLSAGIELRYRFVSFKTEAQLLYANNQSPNPTWAAMARLGFILF